MNSYHHLVDSGSQLDDEPSSPASTITMLDDIRDSSSSPSTTPCVKLNAVPPTSPPIAIVNPGRQRNTTAHGRRDTAMPLIDMADSDNEDGDELVTVTTVLKRRAVSKALSRMQQVQQRRRPLHNTLDAERQRHLPKLRRPSLHHTDDGDDGNDARHQHRLRARRRGDRACRRLCVEQLYRYEEEQAS